LLNYISEEGYLTAEDSVCDMILAERSPCVTRGKAISAPSEVEKTLAGETEVERKTAGNAGVYQSDAEGPMNVRGAVGYILPGGNSILVIYFDAVKCRLLVVDAGTAIDSKVVDAAAAKDESYVSGAIVLNGRGSNFRVCQKDQSSAHTHRYFHSRPKHYPKSCQAIWSKWRSE
jgi:hypothetical protein